jgi:hypothetical protein
MSLPQTLCNIFNTSLPSNADVVTTEFNDADSSEEEEEYYVCLECERLGKESHNHDDDEANMDGNQNVGEGEKEDILKEPKPEPVTSDNESESDGVSSDFVEKYVTVKTEQNIEPVVSQEPSVSTMPDISDIASSVSLDHASESTSNVEKETTDLPENSFTPSVFEDLDELHNTGTIGSSVSSGSRLSTPLPQTPQVKIEGRQLLSIFQRSPENVIDDLSALLRTAGVEITGGDELKNVKIKIETPRSVKKEANSRKRRRSPKFYTPAKRRAVRKGSIGSVKTKSGETKVFTEWDDDEFIESD